MEVFQVQGMMKSVTFLLDHAEVYIACDVWLAPDYDRILLCKVWRQHHKQLMTPFDDMWTLINGKIVSQVDEPDSRILVEMSRSFGDPVLYLKPKGDGDLPIEIDFYKYADVTSFQNRLSHHHIYATGWGYYFIGVYNNDACMEEDTYFNLSISIAPSSLKTVALCPLNCSYPNGMCTEDGNCSCESGFGGSYCEGCESPN